MDGNWDYTEKYLAKEKLTKSAKGSYSKSRIANWKLESIAWVENNDGKKIYGIEAKKVSKRKPFSIIKTEKNSNHPQAYNPIYLSSF